MTQPTVPMNIPSITAGRARHGWLVDEYAQRIAVSLRRFFDGLDTDNRRAVFRALGSATREEREAVLPDTLRGDTIAVNAWHRFIEVGIEYLREGGDIADSAIDEVYKEELREMVREAISTPTDEAVKGLSSR